jgi:fluoride exporter
MNWLLIFFGGGLGAVLRYLFTFFLGKTDGNSFPFNTFFVNILGCFLIGLVFSYFLKTRITESVYIFLAVGVLGGFTTFSSFGLEFVQLLKNDHLSLAIVYVLLTNLIGIGLLFGAYQLVK